jgi:Pro-kumamolisin, activation domain
MCIDRKVTLCICLSVATGIPILAHGQAADSSQSGGSPAPLTVGEAPPVPSRIVTRIDETRLMRLHGNTHPRARTEFDKGLVDPQLSMERMILILKRSPEQEAALTAFMARQLDPKSPDFHHWLTPEEFGRIYGPSDYDISAVTNWLQNHGFSIDKVANGRTFIEFSGTARLVREAFHTEIHRYNVEGRGAYRQQLRSEHP